MSIDTMMGNIITHTLRWGIRYFHVALLEIIGHKFVVLSSQQRIFVQLIFQASKTPTSKT
ncbi:unnamed protein product, partial [Nesidiocoris tenuis]